MLKIAYHCPNCGAHSKTMDLSIVPRGIKGFKFSSNSPFKGLETEVLICKCNQSYRWENLDKRFTVE